MILSLQQIKDKLLEKKKSGTINRAILHQNRIKFHTEISVSDAYSHSSLQFLSWVSTLIPNDKFKIFNALFQYPVKTNELTGIVFDKLSRVFDGRNPAYNYQFTSPEHLEDWEEYRQEKLNEPAVWQTDGWENFKTEINSVLVVDMPPEQDVADKRPAPYFYWLPIGDVLDYGVNSRTQNMEYIIFKQGEEAITVIDEGSYRVFEVDKGQITKEVTNNPHDLGYCPARFFWNDPLSLKEPDIKMHPLSKVLESLDWFLFFHISKRHLDLYGSYPIYSGYESDCDYINTASGDECDGGFLKSIGGSYKYQKDGKLASCPKCGDKRIAGVGSFVTVPIPEEGEADLRNPVQVLTVDKSSLDYNVQEETRLKREIIQSVVGVDEGVVKEQAINEMQVSANFESMSTILNRVKKGFEEAQDFVDETVCRLRYGKAFMSADINYGTEFYAVNVEELRNRYKTAKDSGASEAELDAMRDQLIETEYRHNPTQLQRMLILAQIEPFDHYSRTELISLLDKGIISQEDFVVKLNFSNFVNRFERENGNILDFGQNLEYYAKVKIITDKFKEYAEEYLRNKRFGQSDERDVRGSRGGRGSFSREDRGEEV